jgi:outer membrane protein insertion porin family
MLLSIHATGGYTVFRSIHPSLFFVFAKDYSNMKAQERYKWLEYHKWKFNVSYYLNIVDNLVLSVRGKFGFWDIIIPH